MRNREREATATLAEDLFFLIGEGRTAVRRCRRLAPPLRQGSPEAWREFESLIAEIDSVLEATARSAVRSALRAGVPYVHVDWRRAS